MYEKVKEYCKEHRIVKQDSRVVIGISGGPDSVCLLDILCRMKEEMNLSLYAVHIHHGLRGKNADLDERFTKQLCDSFKVPCYCFHEPVAKRAKEEKISVEEAGRLCRYERMEQVMRETKSDNIAVAHHGNDQAETVLFHLVRGSGLSGLSGMSPKREHIIRPLLCVTRKEILTYLEKRSLPYRLDETNDALIYTRNRIRNEWVPMLEQVNEEAVAHICQTADLISLANDYIKEETKKAFHACLMEEDIEKDGKKGLVLQSNPLCQLHPYLQLEVLKYAVFELIGKKNIGFSHIESLKSLLYGDTGKQVVLPDNLIVKKDYQNLIFTWKEKEQQGKEEGYDYELSIPCERFLEEIQGKIRITVKEATELWSDEHNFAQIILKDTYKKMFDYDKIKGRLHIRTRRSQDELNIGKGSKHKPLRRFFIDEKIPRQKRDSIPILADEKGILWVLGYRIGAEYKVEVTTKRVLLVEYEKKTKENKNG